MSVMDPLERERQLYETQEVAQEQREVRASDAFWKVTAPEELVDVIHDATESIPDNEVLTDLLAKHDYIGFGLMFGRFVRQELDRRLQSYMNDGTL